MLRLEYPGRTNREVIGLTAFVETGDIETCLQCIQWWPGQSSRGPLHFSNIMAADDLAPWFARPSGYRLSMINDNNTTTQKMYKNGPHFLSFFKEEFQLSIQSQCVEMIDDTNIFSCHLKTILHVKVGWYICIIYHNMYNCTHPHFILFYSKPTVSFYEELLIYISDISWYLWFSSFTP